MEKENRMDAKTILVALVLVAGTVIVFRMFGRPASGDKNMVAEKIKAGALVVDVRTPAEFADGHFKGALNIPVDTVQARMNEFGDKGRPIVVYCRSGARSGRAQQMLQAAGYTDVTNGGGLTDMPRM